MGRLHLHAQSSLSTLLNRSMSESPAASPAPAAAPPPADAPADVPAAVCAASSAPSAVLSPADCAQRLKQLFPALFTGAVKPLKLRIQVDIQERAPGQFTKQTLSAFFRRHTGSTSYLMAVAKSAHRYDLDGQPSGELSEEHRAIATQELARRRSAQDERRALEEQQRRNRAGLLRDFQTTTLTRANFCVLKGVAPEELDGLLELARRDAQDRAPAPAFAERPARPARPSGPRQRPAR